MPNDSIRLPLGGDDQDGTQIGGVDLDGKPFTVGEGSLRKTQNLIPDRAHNLVRRGCLMYQAQLTARNVATGYLRNARAVADGSELNQSAIPIWLGVPPMAGGIYGHATSIDGNRMDLTFSQPGKFKANSICVNARMVAPDSLPDIVEGPAGECYVVFGQNLVAPGLKLQETNDPAFPGFRVDDFFWNDTQLLATHPRLGCVTKNRVHWGGFEAPYENAVVIADVDAPLTIGQNALTDRSIIVGTRNSGRLKALKDIQINSVGSPVQTGTLCLTEHAAFLLMGDCPETDDPNWPPLTLELNRFKAKAGCVSSGSVCDTPWGTIWCGPDNVWFLPTGGTPIPIGRKLRPILKAQPKSQAFRIHAVYADGFYRLALFSDGQGPDASTPLGEQWWLDLRDGPPSDWTKARWYGPQVFNVGGGQLALTGRRSATITVGTSYMAIDDRDGQDPKVFGVQYGLALYETSANTLYLPNLVTYDNPGARDVAGVFYGGLVPWSNNTNYAVDDEVVVFPNPTSDMHPARYRCDTAGISAATEPTWTVLGFPLIDGTVSWVFLGYVHSPASVYGSEVLWALDSREYDFGSRMLDKLMQGLELNSLTTTAIRMTLTQLCDGGKTKDIITKDLSRTSGPLLGADFIGFTELMAEEYKSYQIFSNEDTRTLGKVVQYKMAEVAGILIPDGNLDFTFLVLEYDPVYTATLPTNYYANVNDLAAAVVAAMNTVAAFRATFPLGMALTSLNGLVDITQLDGSQWSNGVSVQADRFIWSLLGFNPTNHFANAAVLSDSIPYDVEIGGFGIAEAVARFRPFKRRPDQ